MINRFTEPAHRPPNLHATRALVRRRYIGSQCHTSNGVEDTIRQLTSTTRQLNPDNVRLPGNLVMNLSIPGMLHRIEEEVTRGHLQYPGSSP